MPGNSIKMRRGSPKQKPERRCWNPSTSGLMARCQCLIVNQHRSIMLLKIYSESVEISARLFQSRKWVCTIRCYWKRCYCLNDGISSSILSEVKRCCWWGNGYNPQGWQRRQNFQSRHHNAIICLHSEGNPTENFGGLCYPIARSSSSCYKIYSRQ